MSSITQVTALTAVTMTLVSIACGSQETDTQNQGGAELSAPTQRALIPREVLFGNPERVSVQLSPDGKHIAYVAPVDDVLNIWVQPAAGGEAKPLTRYTDRPVRGFSWAWNSEQLLYGRDKDGDENTHVYAVDVNDGTIIDLTPIDGVKAMVSESERDRPDEVIIGINDRDPRHHDYYVVNTRTGERSLLVQNDEGYLAYMFDPKWNVRGRMQMTPEGGITYEMTNGGDEWFDYLDVSMEDSMTTRPIGFGAEGDVLYGLDSRGRDTAALVSMPAVPGGADQVTVLHTSDKADVTGSLRDPETRAPQAALVEYLRDEWTPLDPSVEKDLASLRKLDKGDFNITSRTADDRTWTVAYLQDAGPVRYWVWDRDAEKGTFLFSHRPDLEQYELAEMQSVEIPTRDGLVMPSYLTRPVGATEATPMVLLVHGGPWARDGWGYNPMHQWLADRGYAVLSPNFRGSTGFGKEFLNAGNREWYAKMQDDLVDATNWAVENGIAQKDKVAIMGGSYGGYATLAGLTRDPEFFVAGVDIVGPSHVATLLQTIPPYWEPMKKMFETRVGSLEEPEYLDSISPLTHVDRISRPLLIAQGANDPRVKISESDQIVEAMESRDLPVTYIVFPDEGHGMARPENMMAFNAITEEFLAKHLGGRVEPIGEDVFDSSAQVRNKGNLALAGLPVWANDGTVVTRPERAPVDEGALTEEQLMQVSMALKQIESFPPQQLPNLLADLERRRAEVPESDLPVFDYMVQQIEAMMEAETRKADASATP